MVPPLLTLASTSPRRAELLRQLAVPFEVIDSGVDEASIPTPADPAERVRLLARAKALAVVERRPDGIVLAADTLVALDAAVLGKPSGPDDAVRMLRSLSGRAHAVHTGVALVGGSVSDPADDLIEPNVTIEATPYGLCVTAVVSTAVMFRRLGDAEVRAYVASGEPLDKAGAYGIQAGARSFVAEVRGCYTNVIGLPLCLVATLLREAAGLVVAAPANPQCQPAGAAACQREPG